MTSAPAKQRGVALITALIIMAIAAAIAAGMIWQGDLDTRRTATVIQGNQAMEYALGAESWAEQILRRDLKQNAASVNLGQDWAQQLPPLPVEGGQITGHIEDMQGRFNLDMLYSGNGNTQATVYQAQFTRLLQALNLDPSIAQAVSDWVNDGNIPTQPGGAKDDFYSRLQPPYLTAQRPMTSVSELMLVKGMTPQAYAALLPYVCAIPVAAAAQGVPGGGGATGWALNVNTAPPLLLTTLAPNISQDQVEQVVSMRLPNGISQSQFTLQLPSGSQVPGFTSSYFLLTVTAEIGSTHVTLYSLLSTKGCDSSQPVCAIRRTFGTL